MSGETWGSEGRGILDSPLSAVCLLASYLTSLNVRISSPRQHKAYPAESLWGSELVFTECPAGHLALSGYLTSTRSIIGASWSNITPSLIRGSGNTTLGTSPDNTIPRIHEASLLARKLLRLQSLLSRYSVPCLGF